MRTCRRQPRRQPAETHGGAEFVAASLASGVAERQAPGPALSPPSVKSGLLGRLRGR